MDRKTREPAEEDEPEGASLPPDPVNAGFLPELLRRGLTLGFTGFFMTEEALRRALGDSVPRDWIEFFVEQSDRTRVEFLDRMSKEFGRVLNALDPVEVLRRLLDGQTIEVKASVRLANSRTGERTSTRVRARSHRSDGSQRSEEED